MHKLQHSFGQRDAGRPARNLPELPFGPWVPDALEKLRRQQRRDAPQIPLHLPLYDEPPMRRAPQPAEKSDRGVTIIQLY